MTGNVDIVMPFLHPQCVFCVVVSCHPWKDRVSAAYAKGAFVSSCLCCPNPNSSPILGMRARNFDTDRVRHA